MAVRKRRRTALWPGGFEGARGSRREDQGAACVLTWAGLWSLARRFLSSWLKYTPLFPRPLFAGAMGPTSAASSPSRSPSVAAASAAASAATSAIAAWIHRAAGACGYSAPARSSTWRLAASTSSARTSPQKRAASASAALSASTLALSSRTRLAVLRSSSLLPASRLRSSSLLQASPEGSLFYLRTVRPTAASHTHTYIYIGNI